MFKDILVPVNISDESTWKKQMETAIELAQQCDATLHIMTVIPGFDYPLVSSFFPPDFEQKARDQAAKDLHAFMAKHIPSGIRTQAIVSEGAIYEQILGIAEENHCDLILMNRTGSQRRQFMLGSNAVKVLQHTRIAVLVVD